MLKAAGGKNVWIVGGGELAGRFYDHGLLDELFVQVGSVTLRRRQAALAASHHEPSTSACFSARSRYRGSRSCTTRYRGLDRGAWSLG